MRVVTGCAANGSIEERRRTERAVQDIDLGDGRPTVSARRMIGCEWMWGAGHIMDQCSEQPNCDLASVCFTTASLGAPVVLIARVDDRAARESE
jgi:hypothetical protein